MKALVFGGSGFIGTNLVNKLLSGGYEVCIVSRGHKPQQIDEGLEIIQWRNSQPLSTMGALDNVEVIINLAGESIGNRRWSNLVKHEIIMSRVKTTQAIVSAINQGVVRPKVFINASAIGYYGPHGDEDITEDAEAGPDFLAQVCQAWEGEVYQVRDPGTRVVVARIGVVLGDAGALKRMEMPFHWYLGGPLGSGNRWLSWIHLDDLIRIIMFAIQNDAISGPVNATAPEPIKMKEFCSLLGQALPQTIMVKGAGGAS